MISLYHNNVSVVHRQCTCPSIMYELLKLESSTPRVPELVPDRDARQLGFVVSTDIGNGCLMDVSNERNNA